MGDANTELYGELARGLTEVHSQKQLEEYREAEAARFHDTCELIAGVGTPEAEGLVLLTLWQEGIPLSSNQIDTALRARTDNPEWLPDKKTAFVYCRNSLEPLGQVVPGTSPARRGMRSAYQFNENGGTLGVETVGLLADWGLHYPDVSIQQLGVKASSSSTRAPESRLNVLLELLTNPNQGFVAVSEIKGLTDIARYVSAPALDAGLLNGGWIKAEGVLQDNDRLYSVNSTEYRGTRPYDKLKPEIKLLYEFISKLQQGETFTHQQALEYVIGRLSNSDPTYDLAEARTLLSIHLGQRKKSVLPGIERLDNYNEGRTRTRLAINDKYYEALSDLAEIVLAIHDRDPAILEYGRKRAAEIISNPQNVDTLLNKSYAFSPHARRVKRSITKTSIAELVAASDHPLGVDEVLAVYNDGTRKPLGYTSISRYLRQLSEEKTLKVNEDRVNPTIKTKQLKYSAALPDRMAS